MRPVGIGLFLALATSGCLDAGTTIDWPEIDGVFYLVSLEPNLSSPPGPDHTLGPLLLEAPSVIAAPGARREAILVFETEKILAARMSADLSNPEGLELSFAPSEPICEHGRRLEDDRVRFPLREFGRAFELTDSGLIEWPAGQRGIVDTAGLLVSNVFEPCQVQGSITVFGDRAQLMAGVSEIRGAPVPQARDSREDDTAINEAAIVDDDRVVGFSKHYLFLFERGQPFKDDSDHVVSVADLYPSQDRDNFEMTDVLAVRSEGAAQIVLLSRNRQGRGSRIDTFAVSAQGLELIATTSTADSYENLFTDGERFLVTDQTGTRLPVLSATTPVGPWRTGVSIPLSLELSPVLAPENKLYMVEDHSQLVFEMDLTTGQTSPLNAQPDTTRPNSGLETRELEYDPTTNELVLAAVSAPVPSASLYARYSIQDNVWRNVVLDLPREALLCGSEAPTCGEIVPGNTLDASQVRGPRKFALIRGCFALLELDPANGCGVSLYEYSARPIGRDPASNWETIAVDGDRVVIGGTDGFLLEMSDVSR